MIPGILFYVVYKYAPFYGLQIAFKKFKIRKGISESPWYDPWWFWFARFWQSPQSRQVVTNTLIISLSKMVVGMLPPLVFALAINECRFRGYARVVQTVSYLPHFLSWIIVFGMRRDKSYDLFIEKYGEELRSDIVKFPHHGRGRDAACQRTRDSLLKQNGESACILSGVDGPELAGKKLTKLGVSWYDLNSGSILYTVKENGAAISLVEDKA